MDIIGARWSLAGAEAVLRLRSLYISGDWDEYWRFHLLQEHKRNHLTLYKGSIPLMKQVIQARCSYYPFTPCNACLNSILRLSKRVAPN